jgi:hypothetical protein
MGSGECIFSRRKISREFCIVIPHPLPPLQDGEGKYRSPFEIGNNPGVR